MHISLTECVHTTSTRGSSSFAYVHTHTHILFYCLSDTQKQKKPFDKICITYIIEKETYCVPGGVEFDLRIITLLCLIQYII